MRRVADAERRQDTRRKIQLGGLVIKAGLPDEEPAVILGYDEFARLALYYPRLSIVILLGSTNLFAVVGAVIPVALSIAAVRKTRAAARLRSRDLFPPARDARARPGRRRNREKRLSQETVNRRAS